MIEARDSTIAPCPWDANFCHRSPLFEPLERAAAGLPKASWPERDDLQALAALEPRLTVHEGTPLRFVSQAARDHLAYETRVYRHGEVEVRTRNWHDLLNALVWRTFPEAKAALNRAHHEAMGESVRGRRGSRRDALTLFDESGVIVAACDDRLLADLARFRWRRLFWGARERVRDDMRFVVFGHALYEKALSPYIGMTGHAVLLRVERAFLGLRLDEQLHRLDRLVAAQVGDSAGFASPRALAPLPVLGIPGWWPDNEHEAFYRNERYFRPARRPRDLKRTPS